GGHLERSGLADDAIGFDDGEMRRRGAPGDDVRTARGDREQQKQREQPAEHGLNDTSLLTFQGRSDTRRYRLTVRTDGSQPSNRGSIPRTATINGATSAIPAKIAPNDSAPSNRYVRSSGVNLSGPASISRSS